MKIRKAVVAAALLPLALAACSSDPAYDKPRPKATVTAAPDTDAPTDGSDDGSGDSDSTIDSSLTGKVTWNNGVSAQLSKFTRGHTDPEYGVPENAPYIAFTITMTNKAKDKKALDLSMTSLSCSDGDEIFDSEHNLNGSPDTHLLYGQTKSWTTACQVSGTDVRSLQVELTPGTQDPTWYRTAIFHGPVK